MFTWTNMCKRTHVYVHAHACAQLCTRVLVHTSIRVVLNASDTHVCQNTHIFASVQTCLEDARVPTRNLASTPMCL